MIVELIPILKAEVREYPFTAIKLPEFPWKPFYDKLRKEYTKDVYAIKAQDGIVGGILVNYEDPELPELLFFEIDPLFRGNGYGKGALDLLINILKQKGFKRLFVQTGRPKIYERLGYKFEKVAHKGLIIDLYDPYPTVIKKAPLSLIYSDKFLIHNNPYNPEKSERVAYTINYLRIKGLLHKLNLIPPRLATEEELLKVHSKGLVEKVKKASETLTPLGKNNFVSKDTYEVAKLAFGSALLAGEMVEKLKKVFVLGRPPGHHATKGTAKGFCFFNNMAGLAITLFEKGYRPMIIDWDAHHGDGTQEILYDKPIMYVSFHQRNLYPNTGSEAEIGIGEGQGYTRNFPLPPLVENDEYFEIFKNVYKIADEYKPDIILVSAGQDGHREEKVTGLMLTSEAYYEMAKIVNELSEIFAKGKIILLLEGGYNLKALAESNYQIVKSFVK